MGIAVPEGDPQTHIAEKERKKLPSLEVTEGIGHEAVSQEAQIIPLRLQSDGQESPWSVPRGQEWTTSDDIRRAQLEGRARPHSPAAAVRKYLN